MKKTYISPVMNVVLIETHHMIAESPAGFQGSLNKSGGAGSAALGRGGSDWDDED